MVCAPACTVCDLHDCLAKCRGNGVGAGGREHNSQLQLIHPYPYSYDALAPPTLSAVRTRGCCMLHRTFACLLVCLSACLLVCGQRGGGAQREARADAPLLASIGSRGGDADTTSAGERSLHVSPLVALAA
jgi:hypothetical protein